MTLTKPIRISTVFLLGIFLASCATPYFGHSKTEWDKMSTEEQNAIKAEYQQVIDSRSAQNHQDKIDTLTETIIDHGINPTKLHR